MSNIDRRWVWLGLGVMSILIRIILGNYPEIIETYYSRGIFIGIRNLIDFSIARLPIPLIYLLILGILCFIFYRFYKKKIEKRTLKQRISSFFLSLGAFVFGGIFLFLFLWGYNYGRIPIEKQIGIHPKPLEKEALREELMTTTMELIAAYKKVESLDDQSFESYAFSDELESSIRSESNTVFQNFGYPIPGRVRARYLYPKGTLLRISTAGFYLPFVGECHIDPGLHPLQIPYVMSHEFAHGYGIGDEGTCNFIAYLTCSKSSDPIMNYTGILSYWRSVAGQYRPHDIEDYKSIKALLPEGILIHMRKINEQMDKYPDIFPAVRDVTYNAYLKAQGVKEGLKSYSRVVLLVNAFRKKQE